VARAARPETVRRRAYIVCRGDRGQWFNQIRLIFKALLAQLNVCDNLSQMQH